MFAGDHGTSARCSSRFVGIIFSLFNDRMAHNQSLTRTCMHVCIICSTRIRYGWMDTIHGCGLDAMGMVCMHGRSWHPVCMHVCHRHALLVCAPSTSQLLVAGARPSLPWLPTALQVYPLLNISAYCSFSHVASGVAVGLILIRKLCLHLPLCRSLCCQHTPSWVSRGWPLSSQPAGEDGTTVWHDQFIE